MDALLLAAVFLIPGLVAVFVPVFPAIVYILIVITIYAMSTGFARLHGIDFGVLVALSALALVNDHLSGLIGAKYGGASGKALFWGFFGLIVGTFIAGPLGAFIGLFLAILIAELTQLKTHQAALKAATGGLIGALAGYLINIVLAFLIVGLFLVFSIHG